MGFNLIKLFYFFLVCYLLVCGCKTIYIQEDSFIVPTRIGHIIPIDNIQEIWLNNENDSINGLFFKNLNSKKIIIFFMGSGGSIWNDFAFNYFKTLREKLDINVFVADYSSFGKNTDTFSIAKIKNQSVVTFDYVHNTLNFQEDSIYVIGFSLGSAIASYLTTERNISNLFLIASFTNAEEVLKSFKKSIPFPKSIFINLKLDPAIDFNIVDYLNKSKNPKKNLMIIHGENDETMPVKLAYQLYYNINISKKELITIEGLGHNNILNSYLKYLINFIK